MISKAHMFLELQLELGSPLCPWLGRAGDRVDIFKINCPLIFCTLKLRSKREKVRK